MHETEKQKINLIYNHNFFNKSLIFYILQDNKNIHYTKSFKGELRTTKQNLHYCWERLIQVLPTLPF